MADRSGGLRCGSKGKTWSDFEAAANGRQVFLYGLGYCAVQFFDRYRNLAMARGIIDNDVSRQEFEIGEILPEAFGTANEKVLVQGSRILDDADPVDTVILIASAGSYQEIVQELEEKGFHNYFVMCLFEDFQADAGQNTAERIHQTVEEYCSLPISQQKILFHTYGNYLDHEKYICNELLKQEEKMDLVWVVSDLRAELPPGVRKVWRNNWKKIIYEMETAHVWISDNSMPDYSVKRPGQIYIQTKHWASITLKRFYLDTSAFRNEPAKRKLWKRESEMIDYIIVGSEFDRDSCRRGFQFHKGFIMAGSPRSDGLFHEAENKDKVYHAYGIAMDAHVLLYAPTYRFDRQKGKSVHQSGDIRLDYDAVKAALESRFGGEWLIALRLHPSVKTASKSMSLPSFVLDVSDYEDSEELVSAFDITVSDFSSIMFEPAFIRKPVFLYTTDLEAYLENEYDLLIDYRELPFDIAENTAALCGNILNFHMPDYIARVDAFFEKYGVHEDGKAGRRAAEFILGLLKM